jgi:hypothetical protein
MSVLFSMRTVTIMLVCAAGLWLAAPQTAQAQSCEDPPRASFDVRENPFNLSAEERDAIIDVVHAFALTWDLRDIVNLPLLFIEGEPEDGLLFLVCTSDSGVGGTGSQIVIAETRLEISNYFTQGPFRYVTDQDTLAQARHFISNIVVKSHRLGDVEVVADLLVTLQYSGDEPSLPVVDYTGMIEAILTKEWGGVWKIRQLIINMDVPDAEGDIFRGR